MKVLQCLENLDLGLAEEARRYYFSSALHQEQATSSQKHNLYVPPPMQ